MKKLFALILAITMMATISVTVFATDVDQDSIDKTGEIEVTFNVAPAYIVTIPAEVELQQVNTNNIITYENDYTITAEAGVRLHKGDTIVVTVVSDYEMTAQQGATLDYTITHKNGDALTENIVATFTTSTIEQYSTIHIAANDPEFAGDYSDTVTFTISVKKPAPETISFTIDDVSYQAEEGMTWSEWVADPAYNTVGLEKDGELYIIDPSSHKAVFKAIWETCSPSDVIVADYEYFFDTIME